MTSFGVEYDTNILVFLPDRRLPQDLKIKIPFLRDDKLSMTLEYWHPQERKVSSRDCLVSLEAQMGIFTSDNPRKFNIEDFQKMCTVFTKNWNTMIDRKKISINNVDYDIVIYSKEGKFKDCALSIPNSDTFGYTNDFFRENAIGTAQITIGIRLPYIISIFSYMSKINDENREMNSLILGSMENAYSSAGHFAANNGIKNLDLIAFLMLMAYYINCNIVRNEIDKKAYVKAYFGFKIRTNLRIIYDAIGKPETILKDFLEHLVREEEKAVDIVSKLSEDFFNPIRGYVMRDMVKKNLEISPLTITKNNPSNFIPVDIFKAWWTREFPEVTETSDTISYTQTPSVDFGEWDIGENNMIYLEYRGLIATLVVLKPDFIENLTNLTVAKFCKVTSIGINLLNKALEVDPEIIIP